MYAIVCASGNNTRKCIGIPHSNVKDLPKLTPLANISNRYVGDEMGVY